MNCEPRSSAWPRWRIAGRYTVETRLHIGSGEPCYHPLARFGDQEADDKDRNAAGVARDRNGALYLPNSSVRGAVRAVFRRRFADDSRRLRRIYELFGFGPEEAECAAEGLGLTLPENDKPGAKWGALKDGLGGSVSFADAFVIAAADCRNPFVEDVMLKVEDGETPNADKIADFRQEFDAKGTLVETSVRIAPDTRAALNRHLANREIVPPGVAFEVAATGAGLDDDDIALLLAGLELAGQDGFGGGRKMGAGRLYWSCAEDAAICRMDESDLGKWIEGFKIAEGNPPVLSEELRTHPMDFAQIQAKRNELLAVAGRGAGSAELVIDLIFDGPFLVRDLVRGAFRNSGGAGIPALPRLGPSAKPVLPGRSVKGALRARARRIEQTLCGDTRSEERSMTDWLFGRADWGALVGFEDFHQTDTGDQPSDPVQHFVAIDRFTGGQASGRLYSIRPAWQPTLRGMIRLDRHRIKAVFSNKNETDKDRLRAALWLLLLTLRDLEQGEIQFGLGAAKGYGGCSATVDLNRLASGLGGAARLEAAFRKEVGSKQGPPALPRSGAPRAPQPQKPASLTEFINPYNFVPVIKTEDKKSRWFPNNEKAEAGSVINRHPAFQTAPASGLGRLRHDIWLQDEEFKADNGRHEKRPLYSGRIICRLTTENPTFIMALAGFWDSGPRV